MALAPGQLDATVAGHGVAVGIADREGLAGVSMRGVADELGVTAMSFYGYVPGKAELLDLMADRVYGELAMPDQEHAGWRAKLGTIARHNWQLYLAHPWLLQIAASRPLLGPNMTAKYDYELRAVAGLGLAEVEMDLLISLVGDYVHGAVRGAIEAAQARHVPACPTNSGGRPMVPCSARFSIPAATRPQCESARRPVPNTAPPTTPRVPSTSA